MVTKEGPSMRKTESLSTSGAGSDGGDCPIVVSQFTTSSMGWALIALNLLCSVGSMAR